MPGGKDERNDAEIDEIVRILDRHGKGNTTSSEAVARVMVPQGAWRRMFNQIKAHSQLAKALDEVFTKSDTDKRAAAIDKVYEINQGRGNNLTGRSGSAINAMIAAYDPFTNVSVVSLKDRRKVIEYFGFEGGPDFDEHSVGRKMAISNAAILEGFKKLGIGQNARTISVFLYSAEVRPLWKEEVEPPPPHRHPRPARG